MRQRRKLRRDQRILFCSAAAQAMGVRVGMSVAEVETTAPRCVLVEEDPPADLQALQALAAWAERFSPLVGLEDVEEGNAAPHGLLLDISGCGACFGGEENLLRQARSGLAEQGWQARLAIANTLGAAWALAHFDSHPDAAAARLPPVAQLAALPIAALRLPRSNVELLAELGIDTIGRLLDLPRASLASRFEPLVLERLDQALGRAPEVLRSHRHVPDIEASFCFEYPAEDRKSLHIVLGRLIEEIGAQLHERNLGARQLDCVLDFESSPSFAESSGLPPLRLEVVFFRPCQSARHLMLMLQTRLESTLIEEAIRAVSLHVPLAEPIIGKQLALFEPVCDLDGLASLLDQLSHRLGRQSVVHAELEADPQPEYACRLTPVLTPRRNRPAEKARRPTLQRELAAARAAFRPGPRPLKLWRRPQAVNLPSGRGAGPAGLEDSPRGLEAFRWDGEEHTVIHAWGPERIRAGWWRDRPIERDYFLVVTERGNRFWLYHDVRQGRWFLHGAFD